MTLTMTPLFDFLNSRYIKTYQIVAGSQTQVSHMQSGDSVDDSVESAVDDTEHTYETNISDDDMPWCESPTKFTTANLHSKGIIPVKGRNYVLIDSDHPVVSLLKRNTHIIGIDIEFND